MITSQDNPQLKHIKKLLTSKKYRHESQQFIAQNPKVIQSIAQKHPEAILKLFINEEIENTITGITAEKLPASLINSLSSLKTPQGYIAAIQLPDTPKPLPTIKNAFILDQIQSPANIGAIIRNAVAFNIGAIYTTPNTADPYHPEAVQASTGTLLNIPILTLTEDTISQLPAHKLIGLNQTSATPLGELNQKETLMFIFGSEGKGIQTKWLKDAITHSIAIPISDAAESLNVAATSAIIGNHLRNFPIC